LYRPEISALSPRKGEYRLKAFESEVLWSIFGPKREQVSEEAGENCIMKRFIICKR
jgi:hypothetical protein